MMDRTTEIILLIVSGVATVVLSYLYLRSDMNVWWPALKKSWIGCAFYLSILAAILLFVWLYFLAT